jgi:hypothetical protein
MKKYSFHLYDLSCRLLEKRKLEYMVQYGKSSYLGLFIRRMMHTYMEEIHQAFIKSLRRVIKTKNMYQFQINPYPFVIWINLDDTFLQSYTLAPYNLYIWPKKLRSFYHALSLHKIGPVMPYMFVLYKFLLHHKIKVIFVSDQRESEKNIVKRNLSFFGVHKYYLVMGANTKRKKENLYHNISRECIITGVLDDQPELKNMPEFIQFPQIYTH